MAAVAAVLGVVGLVEPASAMVDDAVGTEFGVAAAAPTVAPTAARASAARRDDRIDTRREVPAYLSSVSPDRTVRVFSVRFDAVRGERRLIAAKILASQPSTTPDSALMAAVSVTCSPASSSTDDIENAGATQNVVRGTTSTFTPRFVYRATRTGEAVCTVIASGLRPRPVSSGRAEDNVWLVARGSYLQISAPQAVWSRTVGSPARSRVLTARRLWTPTATLASIAGSSFEVLSDHKVTTCSSQGGSRDSSTLGKELCAGHVSTQGTVVRTTVTAIQLTAGGRQCAPRQIFSRDARVTPVAHHQMIFTRSRVTVSQRAGCTGRFRVASTVTSLRGAAVMVHAPSERTTIIP